MSKRRNTKRGISKRRVLKRQKKRVRGTRKFLGKCCALGYEVLSFNILSLNPSDTTRNKLHNREVNKQNLNIIIDGKQLCNCDRRIYEWILVLLESESSLSGNNSVPSMHLINDCKLLKRFAFHYLAHWVYRMALGSSQQTVLYTVYVMTQFYMYLDTIPSRCSLLHQNVLN